MNNAPCRPALAWLIALAVLLAAGCAGQPQVQLKQDFWADKQQRVGVLVLDPRADAAGVRTTGEQGLIFYAISNAQMGSLNAHLEKQQPVELKAMADRVALRLKERGITAVSIEKKITATELIERPGGYREGFAKYDFTALGAQYKVDKLLILSPEFTGSERGYYVFMPTGDPRGNFRSVGQLVEIPSHKLLWYRPIDTLRTVKEPWDQPPDFPNVTAAMREAVNAGIRVLEADLFWTAR